MVSRPLPIGVEFYKRIIERDYYYVDKTLLIKEIIDKGKAVNLFTRPRRFGKTLALSMLRTFFEKEMNNEGIGINNAEYFKGTKIEEAGSPYRNHMGRYPVIFLSMKSAKQPDFKMAYACLKEEIAKEFARHVYLLDGDCIFEGNREKYRKLMDGKADLVDYAVSLRFLSECLHSFHKENVIILIDEYDVPLENAYFRNFYNEMIDFIRSLFESALKTNDCLEFAIVSGCLRISRESIFTGLNNLKVFSVLDESFSEYFGFTSDEVEKMLKDYGISEKEKEVRHWYDGYLFGRTEVYNPWSVINYVDDMISRNIEYPKPYWSNTSSNSIIRELIEGADEAVKMEIEELISGGMIEKPLHEDITYEEIHKSRENLWNFLLLTGYLKVVEKRFETDTMYVALTIPNAEIRYIYKNTIREWFEEKKGEHDPKAFYEGLRSGDCAKIEAFVNAQLADSISYYDSAENFYHGYLLGATGGISGYRVHSNKEQGDGRPDLMLEPQNPESPAIVIEIKRAQKFNQMEKLCDEALRQIEERNYAKQLLREGYSKILRYGFCFCKKSCRVKLAREG